MNSNQKKIQKQRNNNVQSRNNIQRRGLIAISDLFQKTFVWTGYYKIK